MSRRSCVSCVSALGCWSPKTTYPLVQELAVDGLPVAVTCRVLGLSRQGYYKWLACPVTDVDWRQAHLINPPTTSMPMIRSSATA